MPEAPDGEVLAALLAQTRRWARRSLDPAAIEAGGTIPRALLDQAAALGLFAVTLPEEHGGAGLSLTAACALVEEIARVDRSVAVTIGLHLGLGTRGLCALGSEAARGGWLPALAAGLRIAAFGATEPGAGSDLGAIRTTLREDGGALRLDGEKAYVTNAGFAGLFTVLAAAPGRGGERAQALVVVPAESGGISLGPEEHKLGIRASSTRSVRFDGVRIEPEQVLGAPGGGMSDVLGVLAWGRTLMAAGCVGTARAALDLALEHCRSRVQFGKKLVEIPGVRTRLATMAARVHAMAALARLAADAALDDRAISLDRLSIAAKVVCSEGAFEVCDTALQLHGALGFLETTGVARMLRDCRVTRIFEGANDVLRVRAGAGLAASRTTAWSSAGAQSLSLARVRAELDALLGQARRQHGLGLVRRPEVLAAFARADHDLLAAAAALDRVAGPLGQHAAHLYSSDALAALASVARLDDDGWRADAVLAQLAGENAATELVASRPS